MKRLSFGLIIAMLFFSVGCKMKGDTLVKYDGGKITRGEFYDWLEARKINIDNVKKSQKRQEKLLEDMAVERVAIIEAQKNGFDQNPDYLEKARMAEEAMIMKLFTEKEIKEKSKNKLEVMKIQQITLKINDTAIKNNKKVELTPAEMAESTKSAIEKAKGLVGQLDQGADFTELVKANSEDYYKKYDGIVGYVAKGMYPDEFIQPLASLKEKEYTKEPLVFNNKVYLIKVLDRKDVDADDAEDLENSKDKVGQIREQLYRNALKDYLEKLKTVSDVQFNEANSVATDRNLVVFRVGERTVTGADLDKKLKFFMKMNGAEDEAQISPEEKKNFAKNFYELELIHREAMNKKYYNDKDFQKTLAFNKNMILAQSYMVKIGEDQIKISDADMKSEYEKNKKFYFTYKGDKNDVKKRQRVQLNYEEAKGKITDTLKRRLFREVSKQMRTDFLNKYQIEIIVTKLEGK